MREADLNWRTGGGMKRSRINMNLRHLRLLMFFSGGLIAQQAVVTADSAGTSHEIETRLVQRINEYRQSKKQPPLAVNEAIAEQARAHSRAMAEGKSAFSHDGFDDRVNAISKVVPYRSAAENIAWSLGHEDVVGTACSQWLASRGHRKNIEADFDLTGIGAARNAEGKWYLTQIFVLRRVTAQESEFRRRKSE